MAQVERLPRELPPARATIARIAQEAGADPALVRHYFGDRTALPMAVASRITNHNASRAAQVGAAPQVALADPEAHPIGALHAPPDGRGTGRLRQRRICARVREMNRDLVAFYRV